MSSILGVINLAPPLCATLSHGAKHYKAFQNKEGTLFVVCTGQMQNNIRLPTLLMEREHHLSHHAEHEVILHLYEAFGPDCVHHLQGSFSFILWDKEEEVLLAVRDRFGFHSLYYTLDADQLILSSELKHLLAHRSAHPEMDLQGLTYYLSFQYVPAPHTMIKHVYKLPAGHRLLVRKGKVAIQSYWQPAFQIDPLDTVSTTDLRLALEEAVEKLLPSEGEVGCFLSSGIDSTALATLLSRRQRIHTFSIGFAGEQNECIISSQTAKRLGSLHHQWIMEEIDYFHLVEQAVWHQDDPVADPSAIPLYALAQLAAEHVQVVFSGEGADELFGGYRIYAEPNALALFKYIPTWLRRMIRTMVEGLPHFYGRNFLIRGTTPLEERFIGNAKIFVGSDLAAIIKEPLRSKQNAFDLVKPLYTQSRSHPEITRMQLIDLHFWLPGNILAKANRMSKAHAIQLRLPFLDQQLFQLAAQIPAHRRIDGRTTKKILRDAVANLVPPDVRERPKLGFPVPLHIWLKGERGRECIETILASPVSNLLNREHLLQLYTEHRRGRFNHARKIWALYILALWHKLFLTENWQDQLDGAPRNKEVIQV